MIMKNKMLKMLIAVLVFVCAFSFAGCGVGMSNDGESITESIINADLDKDPLPSQESTNQTHEAQAQQSQPKAQELEAQTLAEIPLLKDVYADYFPIGAAVSTHTLDRYTNTNYGSTLLQHFNSFTAESSMKFGSLHSCTGHYDFDAAKDIVSYKRSQNALLRGHALVWYRALPDWVMQDNPTKDVLIARLKNHIENVVTYYSKDVYCWDVANEVLKGAITQADLDSGNIYRTGEESKEGSNYHDFYAIAGTDYIVEAFKTAKEVAIKAGRPNTKLYYNDYSLNDPLKAQAVVKLVELLRSQGAPIDGIGMQGHYNITAFNKEDFEECVKLYTDMGLDVQVTELDISVYSWGDPNTDNELTPEKAEMQAQAYEDIFEVLRRYANTDAGKGEVTGVTVWTIGDDFSWLFWDPIDRWDGGLQKGYDWPSLFNADRTPKEAFNRIVNF